MCVVKADVVYVDHRSLKFDAKRADTQLIYRNLKIFHGSVST
jgi:hypothetical protein